MSAGKNICYTVAAFVIPFNLVCNMTMFWKKIILTFRRRPQGRGGGVCRQTICYHFATFRDSNKFDMQHDHVLKKMNFDLMVPKVRRGGV